MIFSNIYSNDDLKRYPTAIQKAIEHVRSTDFSTMADGQYEIDGDKMFLQLFHQTNKPLEKTHLELHKKYVDMQFWLSGEGLCGVAPYVNKGECIEAHTERDLYFYEGIENEFFIHVTPGSYVVFFPNDAHRPDVYMEGCCNDYCKVVVKVSVDLL